MKTKQQIELKILELETTLALREKTYETVKDYLDTEQKVVFLEEFVALRSATMFLKWTLKE